MSQPTEAVIAMRDRHHAATAPLMEFVPVYADDDNWWWSIACGHHQNLFDAALDRIDDLEAAIKRAEAQIAEEMTHGPNAQYYALRFQAALRGD
jgi:transposase